MPIKTGIRVAVVVRIIGSRTVYHATEEGVYRVFLVLELTCYLANGVKPRSELLVDLGQPYDLTELTRAEARRLWREFKSEETLLDAHIDLYGDVS